MRRIRLIADAYSSDRDTHVHRSAYLAVLLSLFFAVPLAAYWTRHTIDSSSRGADGVRLVDINGDGYLDIATPWEEGGAIRVYIYPGPKRCRARWPSVTVGNVKFPEDAVLVDLDGDLAMDVVSSCEGSTRTMWAHWGPQDEQLLLDDQAWSTQPIPATQDEQMWMFALPADIDGKHGLDLFVGSKGSRGAISWLESPRDARNLDLFELHPLRRAGWITSLVAHDMDGDGDQDLLASDRKGEHRGVFWLEHPGARGIEVNAHWEEHTIGGEGFEVMFLDLCDLDSDGQVDILVATRNGQMLWMRRARPRSGTWQQVAIPNPYAVPHGKAVRVGDVDLDGIPDIVHAANTEGVRSTPGLSWLRRESQAMGGSWKAHNVSSDRGVKFDLVQLIDIDRDGDLDILTCEERDGLGVLWYENPTR